MLVSIGDSSTKATLHIIDELTFIIHFEAIFIDQSILGTLPQSKKVLPCDSKPVYTPALKTTDTDVKAVMETVSKATPVTVTTTTTQAELRVAKLT